MLHIKGLLENMGKENNKNQNQHHAEKQIKRLLEKFEDRFQEGDFERAIDLGKEILDFRDSSLDTGHLDYGVFLDRLAFAYKSTGNYPESIAMAKHALSMFETNLGSGHMEVGEMIHRLSGIYVSQGDYQKAIPLIQRTITIFEEEYGTDHVKVAEMLFCLGDLYDRQEDYKNAIPLLERALSIFEEEYGTYDTDLLDPRQKLVDMYCLEEDYENAQSHLYRFQEILVQIIGGEENPAVAKNITNLGIMSAARGEYAEAESFFQRALTLWEKISGKDNIEYIDCMKELYDLYMKTEQDEKAEEAAAFLQGIKSFRKTQYIPLKFNQES